MNPEYALDTFTESAKQILTSKVQLEAVTDLAKTLLEFADPRNNVEHPSCSSGLLLEREKLTCGGIGYRGAWDSGLGGKQLLDRDKVIVFPA